MSGRISISKDTIEYIHNNADMISIIGEYTRLAPRGAGDYWGCCPFHGEKTASFHIIQDKRIYYCFGCHATGDIITFVREMEKISYVDAITTLAKKLGIQIKYEQGYNPQFEDNGLSEKIEKNIELYERTASMFHYFLMETEQGKFALDYITKRGLNKETLEKFKIGYSPADGFWLKKFLLSKNFSEGFLNESGLFSKKNPNFAFFRDRLMFPIFNRNGQVVAFGGRVLHPKGEDDPKYLNSSEAIHYKKRETLFAFNFAKNSIRQNKKVIICEGYMDCIAYHMSGLDYAVAPLGTAFTEEQLKNLKTLATDGIYLSFDSDKAGQAATKKAIYMCRKMDCEVKVIRLKGGKDPAEILLNLGKENLTAQVNSAILDSNYILNTLGENYPIDTPDGKYKAALEFFEYVKCLQSDIQKESCLDLLCQTYNLKPEAVKRDFLNHNQSQEREPIRQNNPIKEQKKPLTLNAELRGLVAVTADLDQYKILRSEINENDFLNPDAQRLFRILEKCFQANAFSVPSILAECNYDELAQLITSSVASGVYSTNCDEIVQDTIKFIKRNKYEKQREKLLKRINEYVIATDDDKQELNKLISEKMQLDKQIQLLTK